MSYVYIRSEPGLWTVGFYGPDGKFVPESDHSDGEEAARRVTWLNGNARDSFSIYLRDLPADEIAFNVLGDGGTFSTSPSTSGSTCGRRRMICPPSSLACGS